MIFSECLEVQFGWAHQHRHRTGHFHRSQILPSSHGADAFRLWLVESGQVQLTVHDAQWLLGGGYIVFHPTVTTPTTHVTQVLQASDIISVGFRVLLFGSIDITRLLSGGGPWQPDSRRFAMLTQLMRTLLTISDPPSTAEAMVRDGMMRAVLGLCWDAIGAKNLVEGAHPRVPPWLNLVMQELRHRPGCTVSELERLTGYSHSRFFHLFQQHVGVSPRTYLQHYRLDLAKHLLTTTEMSIIAIAEHLGFTNASDFTRFFRRMCLATPSEYRHATLRLVGDDFV